MNVETLKKCTIALGKRALVILPALIVMFALTVAPTFAAEGLQQGTGVDLKALRNIAATIFVLSLGVIGFVMVGSPLWPDWANKNKQMLGQVLMGAIIVAVSTGLGSAISQFMVAGN